MNRRNFLINMVGLLTLSASSCRRPEQRIFSATDSKEAMPIGEAVYYHSIYNKFGISYGLSIKLIDGKPIKIDANKNYFSNSGTTNANIETELYHLYNPERFFKPNYKNKDINIAQAIELCKSKVNEFINSNKQIRIIIPENYSPSLEKLIGLISEKSPNITFYVNDKNDLQKQIDTNSILYNLQDVTLAVLRLSKSVLTINSDIIGSNSSSLFYSNCISKNDINIYSVSLYSTLTSIKSIKDYRITDIDYFVNSLFSKYIENHFQSNKQLLTLYKLTKANSANNLTFVNEIIELLDSNPNMPIIIDSRASIQSQLLVSILNYYRGLYDNQSVFNNGLKHSYYYNCKYLSQFSSDFSNEDLLLILDNDFISNFTNFKTINKQNIIASSEYKCKLFDYAELTIPKTHFLEEWGDSIAINGNYSICQPVIKPLNENSISDIDLVFQIIKALKINEISNYDDLYSFINAQTNDENKWENLLVKGYDNSLFELIDFKIDLDSAIKYLSDISPIEKTNARFTLFIRDNLYIKSERDNHNIYLKELISPINLTSNYNYLEINPIDASDLTLENGDIVKLSTQIGAIEIPILINNGRENIHKRFSLVADRYLLSESRCNIASLLNNSNDLSVVADIIKTDKHTEIIQENANKLFGFELNYLKKLKEIDNFNVYNSYKYLDKRWGLIIDINKCSGCGACVTACKIENNIPVVSAKEILNDKQMNWIDILQFTNSKGRTYFLPYTCQHCEVASCETACPVTATVHSPDGLNEMVYNRCVGTRYCMVACQYKIRKFNFKDHYKNYPEQLRAILNPNVTVRSVGVAEKCTMCIQRINKYYLLNDDKKSELPRTACQQCCPNSAITLVDLNDRITIEFIENNYNRLRKIVFNNYTNPSIFYIYDE